MDFYFDSFWHIIYIFIYSLPFPNKTPLLYSKEKRCEKGKEYIPLLNYSNPSENGSGERKWERGEDKEEGKQDIYHKR